MLEQTIDIAVWEVDSYHVYFSVYPKEEYVNQFSFLYFCKVG